MPTPSKITREQVLAAALALLNQHGPEGLSMRALAESLGVKAPSLYRYYTDKSALEADLVETGNEILLSRVEFACRRIPSAERYLAIGRAYRRFALTTPHLYSLMMKKRLVFPPPSVAGKALWNFVLGIVRESSGHQDGTAQAVAFWSLLHGFVSLEQAGLFGASGPRGGFNTGIKALAAGFASDRRA